MSRTNYVFLAIVAAVGVSAYLFFSKYPYSTSSFPKDDGLSSEKELFEVTALNDVSGGSASGEANRTVKTNLYTLAVRIEKLPDPGKGKYEGWLDKEGSEPIYLGPLANLKEGEYKGSYVLGFRAERDLRDYRKVFITREKADDQKPEEKILEGVFK